MNSETESKVYSDKRKALKQFISFSNEKERYEQEKKEFERQQFNNSQLGKVQRFISKGFFKVDKVLGVSNGEC